MSTRLHDSDRSAGKAKCHPEATAATIRALIFSIWSGPPREISSSTLNEELLFRMLLAVRMPCTSYTSPPETFPMPCTHHLVRLDAHVAIQ
jgi:hypothetical protein